MIGISTWVVRRVKCIVVGHDFEVGRGYDSLAESVTPMYICQRCGKQQRLLYRWQALNNGEQE